MFSKRKVKAILDEALEQEQAAIDYVPFTAYGKWLD